MVGILNRGRGLFSRETIRGSETKYVRLTPLRPGDLVFSRLFAWEGSVAIVDRDGWVSSEFPTYEIDRSQADVRYLSHVIGWEEFARQLANSTSGLGQRRQRVAPARFEAARIPLPSLDTQRAIATRIDSLARMADRLTEVNFQTVALEQSAWKELADVPKVPMGELVAHSQRHEAPVPDRMYRMLGVKWYGEGVFVRETKPGREIKASTIYKTAMGDLIYNRLFAWKGSFALVGRDVGNVYVSNEFPTFTVDQDQAIPEYLEGWLRNPAVIAQVEAQSTGSTPMSRNRFKVDRFLELAVPLPTMSVQEAVITRLAQVRQTAALVRHRNELADAIVPAALNEECDKFLTD